MASPPLPAHVRATRAIAFGAALAALAALAILVALAFLAGAGYLVLLDHLEPRFAALAVSGGALALALIAALAAQALISGAVKRLRRAVRASAIVAVAPHAVRFGLRNARLAGLVATAAATWFALRAGRKG